MLARLCAQMYTMSYGRLSTEVTLKEKLDLRIMVKDAEQTEGEFGWHGVLICMLGRVSA